MLLSHKFLCVSNAYNFKVLYIYTFIPFCTENTVHTKKNEVTRNEIWMNEPTSERQNRGMNEWEREKLQQQKNGQLWLRFRVSEWVREREREKRHKKPWMFITFFFTRLSVLLSTPSWWYLQPCIMTWNIFSFYITQDVRGEFGNEKRHIFYCKREASLCAHF
jgi:hypothetical protein